MQLNQFLGSHTPPPDGPPIPIITFHVNTLDTSNGKGILVMCLIGILMGGSMIAFFVKFKDAKQLKMTSVPESIVTLIGSILCYLSLYFYLYSVTSTRCIVRIWLAMTGYVFMMIPVIMKNVRLYIILKSKKRLDAAMLTLINRIVISTGLVIQLALLGYWFSATKNAPLLIVLGTDAFEICNSVNLPGKFSIQLMEAYTTIVHILIVIIAYMLKDVDPMFNESPALSSIFALVGVLVGVINILPSSPSLNMDLIVCICIWLGVTITLVLLFASKMYEVLFEQIIEKGLLNMSLKSSFEAGRSTTQGGTRSGFGGKSRINVSPAVVKKN
ncbi:UNVERIFIED_CONTAM: hypothetical protein HDU68_000785 [Siphonaria sp. JEL0065]|nr:hypothetical protein HDU68_000785 [Siphonaria sp. JEL0065]